MWYVERSYSNTTESQGMPQNDFWVGRGRWGVDGSIVRGERRENKSIASLPYPPTQQTSANKCCGIFPSLQKNKIISTTQPVFSLSVQIFAVPRTGEKEGKIFLQGLLTHCIALTRVRQGCRQKRKRRKQRKKERKRTRTINWVWLSNGHKWVDESRWVFWAAMGGRAYKSYRSWSSIQPNRREKK